MASSTPWAHSTLDLVMSCYEYSTYANETSYFFLTATSDPRPWEHLFNIMRQVGFFAWFLDWRGNMREGTDLDHGCDLLR